MPIREFEILSLTPSASYLLDNSLSIKQYYDENMMKNVDPNLLVMEALDYYLTETQYSDDKLHLMINWAMFNNKLLTKKRVSQAIENSDKRTFYLVTFTSDPEISEDDNILNITRYRQSHFKKYKYIWVGEKDSSESGKYHQHVLIECPLKVVHTKQNLKPAAYYKGNINVQKVTPTRSSINNIITYLKKEGQNPKGDLDYFLTLTF